MTNQQIASQMANAQSEAQIFQRMRELYLKLTGTSQFDEMYIQIRNQEQAKQVEYCKLEERLTEKDSK